MKTYWDYYVEAFNSYRSLDLQDLKRIEKAIEKQDIKVSATKDALWRAIMQRLEG